MVDFNDFDIEEKGNYSRYAVLPFCLENVTEDQIEEAFRVGDRLLVRFVKHGILYDDVTVTVTYTGIPNFLDYYIFTLKFDVDINGHGGVTTGGYFLDNEVDSHYWNFSKHDNYHLCVVDVLHEE